MEIWRGSLNLKALLKSLKEMKVLGGKRWRESTVVERLLYIAPHFRVLEQFIHTLSSAEYDKFRYFTYGLKETKEK